MIVSTRFIRSILMVACSTALVGVAAAQERIPPRGGGYQADLNGAHYVKPGALLFATFDTDQDFVITADEIESGARRAFVHADADQNGVMTPLEQREWASRLGSEADVIANPTTFLSALPGQVTEEEFVAGLLTFSQRFQDPEDADQRILVKNFTFVPDRSRRDELTDDDIDRVRRPVITDRRESSGIR